MAVLKYKLNGTWVELPMSSSTPSPHAASHSENGTDPITISQSQVSGLAGEFDKKVDTQFTETIPAGAYTFTNGKNGFQAWAWKDANDEWHCVCVNKPSDLRGPVFREGLNFVSFDRASTDYSDFIYLCNNEGGTPEWDFDAGGGDYFIGGAVENAVTTEPIDNPEPIVTSFLGNLSTDAAKVKFIEAQPLPIDPIFAAGMGKAADALAVKNALALLLEIANLAPAFSASTTYAKDAFVSHGGKFYISKTDGNLGHTPPNTTYWTLANLSSLFSNDNGSLISTIEAKVNAMFDNGETTDYPRTTGEG